MNALVAFTKAVDVLTDRFGNLARWAVILSCVISAANALVRYTFDYSSNGFLEIQWYLFAACVMLGSAQVLRVNEHVRVDLIYSRFNGRGQAVVDLLGLVFFLIPVMVVMIGLSWPLFMKMFTTGEMSSNAGGLIRWPAMMMLPLGFSLVLIQGVAEAVKRGLWLADRYEGEFHYERPLQ